MQFGRWKRRASLASPFAARAATSDVDDGTYVQCYAWPFGAFPKGLAETSYVKDHERGDRIPLCGGPK